MTDAADHVVQAIDNAVRDYETSPDAMRWAPDAPKKAAVAQKPRTHLGRHQPSSPAYLQMPRLRERRRQECTLEEINTWVRQADELARTGPIWADVNPYSINVQRAYPPCLGCGAPTNPLHGSALTCAENDGATTATFQPCGCVLTVAVPAILDAIPSGTRPVRWMRQTITADVIEQEGALRWMKDRMIRSSEERPHVMLVLDEGDPLLEEFPDLRGRMWPGDRLLLGLWLKAIPGATKYIVYRAAPDMPAGWMSVDTEGQWVQRAGLAFASASSPYRWHLPMATPEGFSTATAQATGRIEISPEGAVAEVYEVSADSSPSW